MQRMTRRQFVATLGAGAAMWAAGGCGRDVNPLIGAVVDDHLSAGGQPSPADALITTARHTNYDTAALRRVLTDMIDRLGGFGDLVGAGDTVGIKINLTGGSGSGDSVVGRYGETAPELFWTHPEILRVVGELFRDAGAGRILVMEALYDDGSFYNYGFGDVIASFGGELVDLN